MCACVCVCVCVCARAINWNLTSMLAMLGVLLTRRSQNFHCRRGGSWSCWKHMKSLSVAGGSHVRLWDFKRVISSFRCIEK